MKNRFKAIFDNSENIIAFFDKDLNLLEINNKVYDIFHISPEQLNQKNICVLFPNVQVGTDLHNSYLKVLSTGTIFICEDFIPHPSVGILNLKIKAFRVGDELGIIVTNITELRDAVDELNRFTYHSTHDLRSPILTTLGLVNIGKSEAKDKEILQYFELIGQQTQRMDLILLNLVELLKIRQMKIKVEKIDFKGLINNTLASLSQCAKF
jgi:signal transduction histidine kinase